jgi:CheY-like chemotaxis protein
MPNLLVVDDSATQITLIQSIIQELGFTVQTASDGVEALRLMQQQQPNLVITDMEMPEMNGLELIRNMREVCPLVPAVLVTAFGNEHLAAEALGVGAANYISKDHIGILLPDIVQRILMFTDANAESLDLKGTLDRSSFDFLLDCSIERITPLVCLQLRLLAAMNVLHTGERIRIAEALNYLLFYSVVHGNLEEPVDPTPLSIDQAIALVQSRREDDATRSMSERNVTMRLELTQRQARFTVAHQGSGQSIHHAPLPGTPQSFADERGRGMLLLTSVMNEVFIHPATYDVTMVKYIASE